MVIILQHCGDSPASSGFYLTHLSGEEPIECTWGRQGEKMAGDYDQAAQSDLCVWFSHFCKKSAGGDERGNSLLIQKSLLLPSFNMKRPQSSDITASSMMICVVAFLSLRIYINLKKWLYLYNTFKSRPVNRQIEKEKKKMPVTDQSSVYSFLPNNTAIGMSAWSLREAGLHHSVKSLHYITAVAVESHFMNTVLTVPIPNCPQLR